MKLMIDIAISAVSLLIAYFLFCIPVWVLYKAIHGTALTIGETFAVTAQAIGVITATLAAVMLVLFAFHVMFSNIR